MLIGVSFTSLREFATKLIGVFPPPLFFYFLSFVHACIFISSVCFILMLCSQSLLTYYLTRRRNFSFLGQSLFQNFEMFFDVAHMLDYLSPFSSFITLYACIVHVLCFLNVFFFFAFFQLSISVIFFKSISKPYIQCLYILSITF